MASNNSNNQPKKSSWKGRVIGLIAFVIAFGVVKAYRQHSADEQAFAQGMSTGVTTMQDIQAQAKQQHPGMPIGEAARQVSTSKSAAQLAGETGAKKADDAAGQFLGYYMANVRARPEYCQSEGVDIAPFVEAFKRHNAAFYEKSRVINGRGPYSADALEEMLYKQMGPALVQTIRTNTEEAAKRQNVTPAELCKATAAAPDEAVQYLDIQRLNPALYNAMREAQ